MSESNEREIMNGVVQDIVGNIEELESQVFATNKPDTTLMHMLENLKRQLINIDTEMDYERVRDEIHDSWASILAYICRTNGVEIV